MNDRSHGVVRALRDNPSLSRFEAILEDGSVATKPYHVRDGTIALRHAVVPAAHAGRGVAEQLNRFAEAAAGRRGLEIVPACPWIED